MAFFARTAEKLGLKKKADPMKDVKKWKRELNKESRQMDREIKKLEQAEAKSKAECQKLGKQGRIDACKIIAKEIVRTRGAKERMMMAKAQINSISMQLQTQAAMVPGRRPRRASGRVMFCRRRASPLEAPGRH